MKTFALILGLTAFFMMACKKLDHLNDSSSINKTTRIKSIDSFKNGKPYINYLGTEMEGC